MKRMILVPLAAAAVCLTACTGETTATSSPASDTPSTSSSAATSSAEAATSSSEAAPTSEDDGPKTAGFGQIFTYKDGLDVNVVRPLPYFPSESAAGFTPGQKALVFHISVTNNGTTTYDPSSFQAVAQADGVQGEAVFDSAKNIGGTPSALVLPGKSIAWDEVYAFPTANDVALQVTPGFDYQTNVYTG